MKIIQNLQSARRENLVTVKISRLTLNRGKHYTSKWIHATGNVFSTQSIRMEINMCSHWSHLIDVPEGKWSALITRDLGHFILAIDMSIILRCTLQTMVVHDFKNVSVTESSSIVFEYKISLIKWTLQTTFTEITLSKNNYDCKQLFWH